MALLKLLDDSLTLLWTCSLAGVSFDLALALRWLRA
jgi:hypothetical protein